MRFQPVLAGALLAAILGSASGCGSKHDAAGAAGSQTSWDTGTLTECNDLTEAELADAVGPTHDATFESATSSHIAKLDGYGLVAAKFAQGNATWVVAFKPGGAVVALDALAARVSDAPTTSDDPNVQTFLDDPESRASLVPC